MTQKTIPGAQAPAVCEKTFPTYFIPQSVKNTTYYRYVIIRSVNLSLRYSSDWMNKNDHMDFTSFCRISPRGWGLLQEFLGGDVRLGPWNP